MKLQTIPHAVRLLRSSNGRQALKHAFVSRIVNPIVRPMGYTVITDYFYQPIPSDQELRNTKDQERSLASLNMCVDRQAEFVHAILEKYQEEIVYQRALEYFGYQESFSGVVGGDAAFLYSMIRENKPNHVIEVGAGGSTLVIAAALRRNALDTGRVAELYSIDPYPAPFLLSLQKAMAGTVKFFFQEIRVQDTDRSLFRLLGEGDILFVDSSHVFKQGSDVEFEFLSVYPSLRAGVTVHIHDIFFPFDYPYEWNSKESRFWNEQYFLETFLQFNDKFTTLASLSLVQHYNPEIFAPYVVHPASLPGQGQSFWMKAIR